jgi:hypothetical protein
MSLESEHEQHSRVVVERQCKVKGDLVLTRHNGGVLPEECPACFAQLEKQLAEALALSRAAVDAVLMAEDFEGAKHYLGECTGAVADADALLTRIGASD